MKYFKQNLLFIFSLFCLLVLASCDNTSDNNANNNENKNISNATTPIAAMENKAINAVLTTAAENKILTAQKNQTIPNPAPQIPLEKKIQIVPQAVSQTLPTKEIQIPYVPVTQVSPNASLNFCSSNTCQSSSIITGTYLKTLPNTELNKVFYLYNKTASRANLLNIQSTNQTDLLITNNCTSYLDPGKYCSISLKYNPTQYSSNPSVPSATSVVINYSILDTGVKSAVLNVSYICAGPNLFTVATPDDLSTTIQELDMDLNPNLYPYSSNGTAITTSSSTGWNPGNTTPHQLTGTVYIKNTGNEAALVTWPTTTQIDSLSVQVNEGCQNSGSSAYELQPGSYCYLTYTYNPSTIPVDIITNPNKYIQTSTINYTDPASTNSYSASLKVAAYSTTNAVFSTMPDCTYNVPGRGLVNRCAGLGLTGDPIIYFQQSNEQGYNASILSNDTGLSPEYLNIPWLYYKDYAQLGYIVNYFYVYNANGSVTGANSNVNFVIFPKVDGLVLPIQNGDNYNDYAGNDSMCDRNDVAISCWQPISYSSDQSPNCSAESCITNLQLINNKLNTKNILISLPIKYEPKSSAPTAFFAGSMMNSQLYVLTGKAYPLLDINDNFTDFGVVNNSASNFCVENSILTMPYTFISNEPAVNVTWSFNTVNNPQIITTNYYNSACTTPAPTQMSSISSEVAY